MDETMTPAQAQQMLEHAEGARSGMARRSRWLAGYFAAFSIGTAVVVTVVGLGSNAGLLLVMVGWVLLVSVAVAIATSKRVRARDDARIHGWTWAAFGVVYGSVIAIGTGFRGEPAYWLPAAVVAALPTAVAAVVAHRRTRS